jgi:hypothetical protein
MSSNKRGRKKRKYKDKEEASKYSVAQGGSIEVYDEISYDMETSWNSMRESKSERDPLARTRVSHGYSTPSQDKPAGVYCYVSHAMRVGIPWHLPIHKRRSIQGYQSVRYSDTDSTEQSAINTVEATYTYSNDAKCYGSVNEIYLGERY